MPERVLGREYDVVQEFRVRERSDLVVAAVEGGGEAAQGVRVQTARVHPLRLGRAVLPAKLIILLSIRTIVTFKPLFRNTNRDLIFQSAVSNLFALY